MEQAARGSDPAADEAHEPGDEEELERDAREPDEALDGEADDRQDHPDDEQRDDESDHAERLVRVFSVLPGDSLHDSSRLRAAFADGVPSTRAEIALVR